jgi:Tfp pilus assembly major pilin PilA
MLLDFSYSFHAGRWFAAALPYVEVVTVRQGQARSIASFMVQTKLSIKVCKISLWRILW